MKSFLSDNPPLSTSLLSNMPRFDVAELSSYETAKDLLFVDVVGTKVN